MKKVAVVILNYNGKKFLEEFLPNVIENTNGEWAEIVVADNASTDDSVAFMQENYPDIRLIINCFNGGFATGYNLALRQIEAEYFVLLNSDIEVTPHWIEPIIELMDADPAIAACQPKILSYYEKNKFEGWVSYTLSETKYKIPEINDGKPYESAMSHKHSVSVIGTYRFGKRLSASADWIYYSGAPTTYPSGVFLAGGTRLPLYSDRNNDHFPDYHRLDLSLTVHGKRVPAGKRGHGEWNFSVYNVYARHNTWAIDFHYDDETEEITAKKIYLFKAIPSVSYTLTL